MRRFLHRVAGRGPLPGDVLQTLLDTDETKAALTTVLPADDTIPQNTEGTEIFTITMTPRFANSKIVVTISGLLNETTGAIISVALFKDSDADAIRAGAVYDVAAGTANAGLHITFVVDATDVAERTYRVRIGPSAGTLNWLGNGTGFDFGDTTQGVMKVEEIAQ